MSDLSPVAVLLLAVAGDALFGDPPNRFHPVAWMGTVIWHIRRAAPAHGRVLCFCAGFLLVSIGAVAMAIVGWLLQYGLRQCPVVVAVVVQAVFLKCMFSVRSLASAASGVVFALRSHDVQSARDRVAWHLVSRDVSALGESELSAATIESVAENTSDSVVAPLFYFAIAGLPGVFVYRFVNTCDAMIGYRSEELEWFGKSAARLDDLLNIVPSRITAVLMLICGCFTHSARRSLAVWWRDHGNTASPNAGHPMSAAAGVLGVALEKNGHYVLGSDQPKPTVDTIEQAVALLWATAALFVVLQSVVFVFRGIQ